MPITLTSTDTAVLNTMIADISGNANATANLLIQEGTSVLGIDAVFEVILSDANAVAMLNAWQVVSNDADSTFADVSVGFTADSTKATAFRDALAGAWKDAAATGTHDVAPATLEDDIQKYFIELVRTSIDAKLEADGFSDLLQAGRLSSIGVSFSDPQVNAAAADMEAEIKKSTNALPRRSLVKQVDESDMEAYYGGFPDATDAFFLPIKAGKSLTFIFNTEVAEPSIVSLAAPYNPGPDSENGGGYSGALLNQKGANAGTHTKKIALICHLGSRDAYFARDISGATLPSALLTGTDAEKLVLARKRVLALPVGLVDCGPWAATTAPTAPAANSADTLIYGYARDLLVHEMKTQWVAGTALSALTGGDLTSAVPAPAVNKRMAARPAIA